MYIALSVPALAHNLIHDILSLLTTGDSSDFIFQSFFFFTFGLPVLLFSFVRSTHPQRALGKSASRCQLSVEARMNQSKGGRREERWTH